ncbi:formate--tetrahydrofolate ligase [Actinomyces slackii]|uniref:Formate--tetrahydrofolate ligase n=1 Tax=Actinomyces slackii TaxID=52774 RepID=A0A3S4STR8_9ACTO|nr:formate--tetrahydrofolate ligase [Actinomyces slackii]VEG74857.1 Formate--tetrahydrofolate ligase [Actinomyces slackii]
MINEARTSACHHGRIDPVALAARAGIQSDHVIPYGREMAKIDLAALPDEPKPAEPAGADASAGRSESANYVVVTAVTPTPFGEGKTTTAIGLAQGLARIGNRAVLTLRQGAMGPTFGIKGGAGGAGQARILPAEQAGLHLTGDFHAVTAAHNLLSAMIDNHLHHGNELGIQERTITWPRVLDVNDRSLRHIITGLGAATDGVTRQASFDITPASEVMVILSLATGLADLRARLGRIIIAKGRIGWVTAEDLGAAGAMCALLREALEPNLLRTGEGVPVLLHTGPFGNIATGCSSIIADRLAAQGVGEGGYVLTEAGFGADMGLERFIDVKCARSGMSPRVAVVVVSVRALKAHSGRHRVVSGKDLPEEMLAPSAEDVRAGADNLLKHLEIVRGLGLSPVVAINVFPTDHDCEIEEIRAIARQAGARVAASRPVTDGGAGCEELAQAVVDACRESTGQAQPLYRADDDLRTKISAIATMYGAQGVDYQPAASRLLEAYEADGFGNLPVLIAKTPLSLSADPSLKGAPTGWRLPVREVRLAAGAGYVYAICGNLSTMPGLPSHPAAQDIDVDTTTGAILGLR